MTALAPIRMIPLRSTEPPIISVDELTTTEPAYVQEPLAFDYTPDDDRFFDRQRTRSSELPDPSRFAPQLAQALVEVMVAARPAPQVIRWCSAEVYAVLTRRALVAARRGVQNEHRPVVRRVRICEVADGAVEIGIVVRHPDRLRAMALRMVGVDHRWVVTELVIG